MKNRFGVDLDPNKEVFSLVGSKEGISNLMRFLITQKDTDKDVIMIPDPCYASYIQFIQCAGGLAYPMPLTKENNYMPNFDEVYENFIKDGHNPKNLKALVINYPNNPLGVSATREYVQTAIDFCKKHKILLISDLAYLTKLPNMLSTTICHISGIPMYFISFCISFDKCFFIIRKPFSIYMRASSGSPISHKSDAISL